MTETPKKGEAELYALLEAHGIAYAHAAHAPVFTVEEAHAICGHIPGAHVKNMFMKEKKGGLWLATCLDRRRIRIRDLEREVGAKGLSFGKPEVLWDALGVRPGSVTPFAIINDPRRRVTAILDRALLDFSEINAHPLHNEATTTISPDNLMRFFALTGHEPILVDFDALEAKAEARGEPG